MWAALKLLENDFEIFRANMHGEMSVPHSYDFILGWGAFGSPVDVTLRKLSGKKGLCIGGNAMPPYSVEDYSVLFYETDWYKPQIAHHPNIHHAFGINTDIYNPWPEAPVIWDWLSVGSFSYWKRHERILAKSGTKLVVGEIQRDNWSESFDIISDLLLAGVGISDMLYPTKLRNIYNCSGTVYIPADTNGGGERAVLEARACGRPVEIEPDNPKLAELLNGPVYDHIYYYKKLRDGISEVLNQ